MITTDWDSINYPDACGDALTVEFTASDTVCGDSDVALRPLRFRVTLWSSLALLIP